MLYEFLLKNEVEILAMTEKKTRDLAGHGPTSEQLKKGLPIFYKQLITVLQLEQSSHSAAAPNLDGMAQAARNSDEPAMADASGRPEEVELAKSAGRQGVELLRLGYTLSHVVHAYGAMCQSITELATNHKAMITTNEFHDLNQCLDVAIAGAVTAFEAKSSSNVSNQEIKNLGFLAHELRNALNSVTISHQLIKRGLVATGGSTNQVLERGLRRIDELIDRSLTEVRLRVDPVIHAEHALLSQLVDQIIVTAEIEASSRKQVLEINIDVTLVVETDQQLLHSAVSNLIQNAIKYTRVGGKIKVRGAMIGEHVVIEVEDECGGLPGGNVDLFKAYEQQHANRNGVGLGLTIAQRAILLNQGTIEAVDLPGIGCIFKVILPKKGSQTGLQAKPAA